ncbi:hypothetical protein cypCar_00012211 [Cyprinus carpio]|nr:hypothetical protein cypCar_00012211 [Cyprinus carpio]
MVTSKETGAAIIALHQNGLTSKEIATKNIAPERAIYLIIKNFKERGSAAVKKSSGRPRVSRRHDLAQWRWKKTEGWPRADRKTIQVEFWAKNRVPGGGRPTESIEVTMEEGASKMTEGSWSRRRSQGADDSRGATYGGGAGGGGARGRDGELMSQGDTEDLEGQGGADGASN